MADAPPPPQPRTLSPESDPKRRPSRSWYVLAAVLMLVSLGVFGATLISKSRAVQQRIEQMPRFVAPIEAGAVVELTEPGQYTVFHENRGSWQGEVYETPRRQVWPTMASPAMVCSVFEVDSGDQVEVRLPGMSETAKDKRKVNEDVIPAYDLEDRQGHGVWVFNVEDPGRYRIVVAYVPEVAMEIEQVEVPEELTREAQRQMTSEQGKAYEEARREAQEKRELARLERLPVLFAVGKDPSRGSFYNLFGLKGAAGVLAFGFTASVLIALVTLMLRGGHVTPRGDLTYAQRGVGGSDQV